jgi:hypothetical protein
MRLKTLIVTALALAGSFLVTATPAEASDAPSKPLVTKSNNGEIRTLRLVLPGPDASLPVDGGAIICTINLYAWYEGSGHNLSVGETICSAPMNVIGLTMHWYYYSSGAIASSEIPRNCYNTTYCVKGGGFDSYSYLNVDFCAFVAKSGYTSAYGCTWVFHI